MRRLSAALTCLALVPALGGLAACSVSDGSDTDRKSATPTTAPVAKEAGAAGSVFAPGTIATHLFEGILQGAGAEGFTFLSDLLFGDGDVQAQATTAQLDQIQTQLDQIAARLDTIDDDLVSIKGQLASDGLGTKLDTMNGWNNEMTSLYREYFIPIASAAKDVSVAKKNIADAQASATTGTAGTSVPPALTDALTASTKALQDKRSRFDTAFMNAHAFTIFADQHDEMYPRDPNVSSVLKLAGRAMESKGYATWTDSQRLSSLYLTLSDQEALSALLIIEHDKMFGSDAATQKRHRDEYVSNVKIEKANLAPEIPWGQVKVGQQMFLVPGWQYQLNATRHAWLPISPEGVQLGTPLETFESVNPGWGLPTDAQITALYNGTKNTSIIHSYQGPTDLGPTSHLGSIWQNSGRSKADEQTAVAGWGQDRFWTKDTWASNPMNCIIGQYRDVDRVYTLHHMAVMSGATAIAVQGQPGRIPDQAQGSPNTESDCDWTLSHLYDNETYGARVMLTRAVDADTQDYMAQRSTALPAPTS